MHSLRPFHFRAGKYVKVIGQAYEVGTRFEAVYEPVLIAGSYLLCILASS